jgi:SAM-dependent methyltransferase
LSIDVVDLRAFYAQPLGVMTRRLINQALRLHWDNLQGQTVLGIGYCTPYLGLFRGEAERALAFMPARQGAIHWPTLKPSKSAMVMESRLPLADASVDRLLLVHALENTDDAHALLGECWRVLAGGGRILAVVPNRNSLWALRDMNPFAQGKPYSRRQLTELLRVSSFTPLSWSEALWMPPVRQSLVIRSGPLTDRMGRMFSLPMPGTVIVEASKQVFRPVPARGSRYSLPNWSDLLSPQPQAQPGMGREHV